MGVRMDKFDRKPAWKARYRTYLLAGVGMVLLLAGYVAMARFADTTFYIWGLSLYLAVMVLGGLGIGLFKAFKTHREWLQKLALQPIQGPGFTPLELAALEEFLRQAPQSAHPLHAFLTSAEVTSRFNTGNGCITTIRSGTPHPLVGADAVIAWFVVAGVTVPVGCRFWTDDAQVVDLMEFFTGGQDTHGLDWAAVSFESAETGFTAPPVVRPIATAPDPAYVKVLEA
jgi:Ca2+/Na+ antiporter